MAIPDDMHDYGGGPKYLIRGLFLTPDDTHDYSGEESGGQGVAGSNPVSPTKEIPDQKDILVGDF